MHRVHSRDLVAFWFFSILWSGNLLLIKGSLLGHERITARAVGGGALILSGVAMLTVRTRAASAAPAAAG